MDELISFNSSGQSICRVVFEGTLRKFSTPIDYIMRLTTADKAAELGFTLQPKRSRRVTSINLTDLCFADDIVLLSNQMSQAKELLKRLEHNALSVGLHVNAKKTEIMCYNQDQHEQITTRSGETIAEVDNFKYLGGWMKSSEHDVNVRIALT